MPMSTITVAGISPELRVLGNIQQFNYSQPLSAFQLRNDFIPTALVSSQFNQEISNNLLSGFRWSHITTNTDTYGSLILQSFVNAQSTGSDIMKFSSTGINILKTLNLNDSPGASGQVLTSQGVGNAPIWTTNGSGSVTAITAGAGLSGGTITTSGTINIADTAVTPDTYRGPVTVNSRGQITAANNISGVLGATHIINNVATATVISTANTFTKVLGTSHASTLNGFTEPANNRLEYVESDTITAMVSVDISIIPTVSSTLGVQIYKNGSPILGANYNYQATPAKALSLTVRVPVQFSTNNYVEVYITSDNISGDTVMVSDMNMVVTI